MGNNHAKAAEKVWNALEKEADGKVHWKSIRAWVDSEPAFKGLDTDWKATMMFKAIDAAHDSAIDHEEWMNYFKDWSEDQMAHIARNILRRSSNVLPQEYEIAEEGGEDILRPRHSQHHDHRHLDDNRDFPHTEIELDQQTTLTQELHALQHSAEGTLSALETFTLGPNRS